MRIAMVSEHASPLATLGSEDAGGQNVHVDGLSRAMVARGHEVVVYTRRDGRELPDEVEVIPGYRVHHVPAGPPAPVSKDSLLPFMQPFGQYLRQAWQQWTPDVAHAHFWMSGIATRYACNMVNVPFLLTFHALGIVKRRLQGPRDTSPQERVKTEKQLAQAADRVIATASEERAELLDMDVDAARLVVIPCGVDVDRFEPPSGFLADPALNEPLRVLSLGRMVPRKGVDDIIRSLVWLPSARLTVVGGPNWARLKSDAEYQRLHAIARSLGVIDRVRFLGAAPRDRVPSLIGDADVVACVPWYEPFGLVPLEAMASSKPVVTTDVGGFRDTVEHGVTGWRVPVKDPESLARTLNMLGKDPARGRAFGRAGRSRVVGHFSWQRVAERTESVYEQVRSERTRAASSKPRPSTPGLHVEHVKATVAAAQSAVESLALVESWGRQLAVRLSAGHRLLIAGNGGSAAEAQHLAAELVGRFQHDRRAFSAIALHAETSSLSAIVNDFGVDEMYARQVEAHGRPGDVLLLLSTSGRSQNLIKAASRGRSLGLITWALTGRSGVPLTRLSDESATVESDSTSAIQEVHLMAVHILCSAFDAAIAEPSVPDSPASVEFAS